MECEICGNSYADYVIDPYNEEMGGLIVYMWLCSECYRERVYSV